MSGQLPPGTDLAANSQPEIIGAVSATWALATIALFLRYFCRRISKAGLWWDDYLMIPGYIFTSIISWVTITYMMDHGFGKHIYIQPQERFLPTLMAFLKALFIAEVCYTGTIVFVKFSILAFYWRLFRLDNRVRYSVIALSVVVTMWGIAVFIIVVAQCRPLKGFWDKTIQAECTVNSYKFFYGNSTPNIITDILLMLTPLPAIWTLRLELRQKISLSGIFLLGIFVTAVSITRLIFLVSLDINDLDVTWVFIDPQIWTCVELNIAVVCGCLPQLRPLLMLITTGSASSGSAGSNVRATDDTSKSSKRPIWGSKFSTKDDATETSVSDAPLLSAEGSTEKNAKYIKLRNMENAHIQENRSQESKNGRLQVNVQTEWTVSSQTSK